MTLDQQLEDAINKCTSAAELRELLMQRAERDGLVRKFENDYIPTAPQDRIEPARPYEKDLIVENNGRRFAVHISAPSLEKLAALEERAMQLGK